jgi:hypothetical protein
MLVSVATLMVAITLKEVSTSSPICYEAGKQVSMDYVNNPPGWGSLESETKKGKVKVSVSLRLTVYRQSVSLGDKPLETHDRRFFQLNPCGHSPYVTSSLTRKWVCLL